MKRICLLGATGSIGKNCLDIVKNFPDKFDVAGIAAHSNIKALFDVANTFRPEFIAITGAAVDPAWRAKFSAISVKVLQGSHALEALLDNTDFDLLVNAVVGAVGLRPTLKAIEQGKDIAIANKETLVMAGKIVTEAARKKGTNLFPIDSEHSALWQCLAGEQEKEIEKLILTASGGPFRTLPEKEFKNVSIEQALNHPNWKMGPKITIDSATLMNKGLEIIEAYWLFDVSVDQISVVVHPQSIIHSMVEFQDGSIKAQLGLPDMRLPIQYAMTFPQRFKNEFPRMRFSDISSLTFFEPDYNKFRALQLAFNAIKAGGTASAILNAANEVAVQAFLDKRIRFDEIPRLNESALESHNPGDASSLESVLEADRWARIFVSEKIGDL